MHINRIMIAIGLMFLIPINAFATDEIDKCASAVDHVSMRKCLEDAATRVNNELTKTENRLIASLESWDQDQNWKDKAIVGFKDASAAFRSFQKKQCDFEASTAAGGNAAGDLRLECIYRMAKDRVKLLVEQEMRLKD